MLKGIYDLLKEHPFWRDFPDEELKFIASCGRNEIFKKGEYLFEEGQAAHRFFILRRGKMALNIEMPGKGPIFLETLGAGEVVGWSWLFPPHVWTYDGLAVEEVHAIGLDGGCLRTKCESNPSLHLELMKRFSQVLVKRLRAGRMQMLNLYDKGHRVGEIGC